MEDGKVCVYCSCYRRLDYQTSILFFFESIHFNISLLSRVQMINKHLDKKIISFIILIDPNIYFSNSKCLIPIKSQLTKTFSLFLMAFCMCFSIFKTSLKIPFFLLLQNIILTKTLKLFVYLIIIYL